MFSKLRLRPFDFLGGDRQASPSRQAKAEKPASRAGAGAKSRSQGTKDRAPPPLPPSHPLLAFFDDLLGTNAPFQIPAKLKSLMVKFGPWLVIGLMLLVLPGQLINLGMRAALLPFASMGGSDSGLQLAMTLVLLLLLIVVLILALPGLYGRKAIGWQFLLIGNLVNLVHGLMNGGIIGPVLGALIGLYVLFQVRRYYS